MTTRAFYEACAAAKAAGLDVGLTRTQGQRNGPTLEERKRVSIVAGAGISHEVIALMLGISRAKLEKNFEYELSTGAYQRCAEVIEALHESALNGNVSAQKAYAALGGPVVAAPPLAQSEEKKEPALGKKEQAQQAATTAHFGTDWHELLPTHNALQ